MWRRMNWERAQKLNHSRYFRQRKTIYIFLVAIVVTSPFDLHRYDNDGDDDDDDSYENVWKESK
jgi:hypothetical protein